MASGFAPGLLHDGVRGRLNTYRCPTPERCFEHWRKLAKKLAKGGLPPKVRADIRADMDLLLDRFNALTGDKGA